MHLSRLTPAEMLPLSHSYLDPAEPAHQALVLLPDARSLLPRLQEAHQVLLASQSQDDLRAGSLQRQVAILNAEYQDLAHGIDSILHGLEVLAEDDDERAAWARLHALLLPDGGKLAAASYEVEASNAMLLRQILDGMPAAEVQRLEKQGVGHRSLRKVVERWIAVGTELGEKEQERQALPVAPSDEALKSAQMQWVRIVGALVAMLRMSSLLGELPDGVKRHVLDPLQKATERYAPRRAVQEPRSETPPEPRSGSPTE